MGSSKKDEERRKAAMAKLYDASEATVLKALDSLMDVGNPTVIAPLVELHVRSQSDMVKAKVESIFFSLKMEGVVEPIIEMLKDDRYEARHALLLAALWNSGIFPGEHIDVFTKVAINGDYLIAIEAVTVIENIEPPFHEDSVSEAAYLLEEYLNKGLEEDKRELLLSLGEIIEGYQGEIGF